MLQQFARLSPAKERATVCQDLTFASDVEERWTGESSNDALDAREVLTGRQEEL